MRKIIVISMITLDGVMQAPGGREEDTSDGFEYGGWTVPYSNQDEDGFFTKMMQPTDYLLGRRTFEIWEKYWPEQTMWPGINQGTKYVLSNTRDKSDWDKSVFVKDLEGIQALKKTDGADLEVWGSGKLIQLLLKNDLVDELKLITYPVTLGQGHRLFGDGTIAAAFTMGEHTITKGGVVMASYLRAGDVVTGTVGE